MNPPWPIYYDGLDLPTHGIVGTEFEDGVVVFFNMNDGIVLALYPRAALARDAKTARCEVAGNSLTCTLCAADTPGGGATCQ